MCNFELCGVAYRAGLKYRGELLGCHLSICRGFNLSVLFNGEQWKLALFFTRLWGTKARKISSLDAGSFRLWPLEEATYIYIHISTHKAFFFHSHQSGQVPPRRLSPLALPDGGRNARTNNSWRRDVAGLTPIPPAVGPVQIVLGPIGYRSTRGGLIRRKSRPFLAIVYATPVTIITLCRA